MRGSVIYVHVYIYIYTYIHIYIYIYINIKFNSISFKLFMMDLKLWERMIEARLREITNIADNQFGFRPGKSTTEPIFALGMLQEKYREKNKAPHGFRRP